MRSRGIYLYLAFIGVLVAIALGLRVDEAALPARTEAPWPDVEVTGLRLPAGPGRPALVAVRAKPAAPRGVLQLGGVRDRLALEGVTLDLAGGLEMRAATGELAATHLSLLDVRLVRGTVEVGRASAAEFDGERVRLPGLSRLATGGGAAVTVDFAGTLDELRARLGR